MGNFQKSLKELIAANRLSEALEILKDCVKEYAPSYENPFILVLATFNDLNRKALEGRKVQAHEWADLKSRLLTFVDMVPSECNEKLKSNNIPKPTPSSATATKVILVLSPLPLERDAVLDQFPNRSLETPIHPTTKDVYKTSFYEKRNIRYVVHIGITGQTNSVASTKTERAIEFLKPDMIFLLGVGGGIKDVNIGDIVIGDDIVGYEKGKDKNGYKSRQQHGHSTESLLNIAEHLISEKEWKDIQSEFSNGTSWPAVKTLIAPIASGEKVLADEEGYFYQFLQENCSQCVAVEMEGLGFTLAGKSRQTPMMVIRGISDLIEGKTEADGEGSQPYAAKNAAVFLKFFIGELDKFFDN